MVTSAWLLWIACGECNASDTGESLDPIGRFWSGSETSGEVIGEINGEISKGEYSGDDSGEKVLCLCRAGGNSINSD
jgi:hypothetical protein